jgi:two-component system sensor histidine kinase BaeS
MFGGWLALRLADRAGLSIRAKTFLGSAIASGVALLNVAIVAQLMFVSTAHDLKLLLALTCFSAVVSAFLGLWVASTVAGRLDVVLSGIRRLASGDYSERLPVSGGDEVATLAAAVNSLAAKLQAAQEQREALDRERIELTAAVSHDLRTPLASMRAMVEALDDQIVIEHAEVGRYYQTMRKEIERLDRLIDDLFELAQADAGSLELRPTPLALQEVAAEVADAMQAQALRAGVTLSLEVEGRPPPVRVDGTRMERVIANLIRNALEHTNRGGRIIVTVLRERAAVVLRVADSGDGIEPAELEHVWERFYRGEKSRRRAEGSGNGAGLGLAIARALVEAHGGSVQATSVVGQGATFEVRLPLSDGGVAQP